MKPPAFLLAALLLAGPIHAHVPDGSDARATPQRPWFHRWFHRHRDAPQWDGVHPELRLKLETIQALMREEGFDLRLMEGFRSDARQARLMASGSGVTQVGAGRSCHNHGFAADMVIFVRGRPSWDLNHSHVRDGYVRFGALATAAGLRWGGAWADFQDMPHVELRDECLLAMRSLRRGETRPQWSDLPSPIEVWPGVSWAISTTVPGCLGLGCLTGGEFPSFEVVGVGSPAATHAAWDAQSKHPAACAIQTAPRSFWRFKPG